MTDQPEDQMPKGPAVHNAIIVKISIADWRDYPTELKERNDLLETLATTLIHHAELAAEDEGVVVDVQCDVKEMI